jgi:nicotinate-nucleotide pyrophosphorylase (carboxylating)
MAGIDPRLISQRVRAALQEDIGPGDATTLATISRKLRGVAEMRAREPMTVAGLDFGKAAFRVVSARASVEMLAQDGDRVHAGDVLLRVTGSASGLLTAERVALNFVQRLSGIATLTRKFVDAVAGTGVKILDTRKTTPGLRLAEKYAVACGGGTNHRIGLHDLILIKDNHLVSLRDAKPNAIAAAVRRARKKFPKLRVEVEADTLEQVRQAVDAGADIVLLDNMSLDELREAVDTVRGRAETEASGGVNLETVRSIAETGVNLISVGAITHSARAMDVGLDFRAA